MTRLLLFYSGKAEQMTVINCSVLILTSRKYVLELLYSATYSLSTKCQARAEYCLISYLCGFGGEPSNEMTSHKPSCSLAADTGGF